MNTYMSSMYYYAGVAHDNKKRHRWERVRKCHLDYYSRNRASA